MTDYIYRAFPELPEGELAKVRAAVVSAAALAEVAAGLELGDALLLGKGEAGSGGREKPSILADALCMHLDSFQRIVVAPASISVIRYTPHRPFVERINDTGDLGSISPYPAPAAEPADPAASTDDLAAATDGQAVAAGAPVPPSSTSDAVPGGVAG